jgi:uncharacterized protein (TIGR02246 family)
MEIVKRCALFAMAVLGLLAAAPFASAADDAATIRAGTEGWIKAHNAGNADAIAAMYAEDAVVMPPGAPVTRGRAAIKQFIVKDIADARAAGITLVLAKESDVAVKGDLAWHAGTYTVKDKAGATVDSGGYMEIWRKAGGKWLIIRDIWNSSTPPGAPAAAPAAASAAKPAK